MTSGRLTLMRSLVAGGVTGALLTPLTPTVLVLVDGLRLERVFNAGALLMWVAVAGPVHVAGGAGLGLGLWARCRAGSDKRRAFGEALLVGTVGAVVTGTWSGLEPSEFVGWFTTAGLLFSAIVSAVVLWLADRVADGGVLPQPAAHVPPES